jgi:hypothetical protein
MDHANQLGLIEEASRRALGPGVSCSITSSENSDGAKVLWIAVTYPSHLDPTVAQMDEVVQAAWGSIPDDETFLPVVSFQSDDDRAPIAAE